MEWTGAEIRRRRLARGLQQDELAHALGMSRSVVNKWETGQREPRGSSIRALERVLGDPPADTTLLTAATDVQLIGELVRRLGDLRAALNETHAAARREDRAVWRTADFTDADTGQPPNEQNGPSARSNGR